MDFIRLKAIPLFASLSDDELAYVQSMCRPVTYSANELVVRQDEPSDTFYIVEVGQARLLRHDDYSGETAVLLLGPGQFFGETGLLYHQPRNATIETVVNTTLLCIDKDNFDTLIARLPTVRRQLEAAAGRRRGLHRFDWQRHDEVALWETARSVIPSVAESLVGLIFWVVIAYGMVAFSAARLPHGGELPFVWQWGLRIGALAIYSLVLIWYVTDWLNDRLVLTNQRVVHAKRTGFLREMRDEIPTKEIHDVVLSRRGLLAKVFQFSDIIVKTTGNELTFTPLGSAEHVRDWILYQLLDETVVNAQDFDLSRYRPIFLAVTRYPDCQEIARLIDAFGIFLSYDNLSALPAAAHIAKVTAESSFIRSAVTLALNQLGQVGAEIATCQAATSRVSQLAALARATDALDELDKDIMAKVLAPEQAILRRIVRQWRRLVSEAGGRVGRAELASPVVNPYVVGNPVTGNLFVGREGIMRRLEELWSGGGPRPSVVLYGHRRMGKSSILRNLGARFGADTVVVDFNMQRVGLVTHTGELLCNLAVALYDSFHPRHKGLLSEPDEKRFNTDNPYTVFDRFLKQIDRARVGERFIIAIDEFELIEEMFALEVLEPRLLDFFRGLVQTYPWFVMAFAGLHTLQEMTQDYWHPLFGSVTAIPVSFLTHDAAWRLITQPTPDFALDYDTDAVERIITLTQGQPYLVQLIGHGLVTRFNRETFEEGLERKRRLVLSDVEAVINASEFYRDGEAYFAGVWVQAEKSEPPGQTTVLGVLAQSEVGLSVEEITRQTPLALENVQRALEALAHHDVLSQQEGQWKFTVELMRRWVAQRDASDKN